MVGGNRNDRLLHLAALTVSIIAISFSALMVIGVWAWHEWLPDEWHWLTTDEFLTLKTHLRFSLLTIGLLSLPLLAKWVDACERKARLRRRRPLAMSRRRRPRRRWL